MKMNNILTERLILIPVTLEVTRSLLDASHDEIHKLGFVADEMWPTSDTKDILPIVNRALEQNPETSGFEFWMIVKKDGNKIIGDIGFHGKPNAAGEVEVGFGFVETERAKGYGFEALSGIMEWLGTQVNVSAVKSDCLISNKPSIRILEKAGLKEIFRNEEYIFWRKELTCN